MKLETLVFDHIRKLLPKEATKTIVYANVSDTSYEIFFYCFLPQSGYRQCYELAEDDILDAHLLDTTFSEISKVIKADKKYITESSNLFTFIIDTNGVKMTIEHLDKEARMYRVKKEWREKYLHS